MPGQESNKQPVGVSPEELALRFTYHPPKENQPARYTGIRNRARELADLIVQYTPASREQSLALTKLEEAVMWANAAIARNE
jgi:hypothetical protein